MAAWTVCILLISAGLIGQGSKAQNCGQATLRTRIVGGNDATEGEWPWQVSMHYKSSPESTSYHICGGTVISEQWVLTAAHCVAGESADKYVLHFGMLSQSGNYKQKRNVQRIIVHRRYNVPYLNNDIALMMLDASLTFDEYIQPVCLASGSSEFHTSTSCFATGWGRLGKDEPLVAHDLLQEVQIPVVGNRQCTCSYSIVANAEITRQMICAGEENKGTCQGDSGGPLQCNQNSKWIQAGITSFGIPCALKGYPEVYARVSKYENWIKRKVSGATVHFVTFTSSGRDPDRRYRCQDTASQKITFSRINRTSLIERNATSTNVPNTTVVFAVNTTSTTASTASTITAQLTFGVIFVTVFLQHIVAP